MSSPAPRLPLTRRTTLGAAAWSAPLVVVATAAPALAASGPATAIQRVDPTTGSFGIGTGSRTVRTRLVNGSTPVVGAVVTFVLSDAAFVTFTGGSTTTTTAVTDATGVASATLVPVAGAPMGSSTTLTATHQALSLAWTVTYARIDTLSTGSTASHRLLTSSGVLYAFGYNPFGQVGDGSTTNGRTAPVPVARTGTSINGKTITTTAGSFYHSVALASDGTVHTWGDNTDGQLGNGTTTRSPVPVQVANAGTSLAGKTITAVAAGFHHTVALASDGTIHTWGRNTDGQLGNGTTTPSAVPVQVSTTGTSLAGKTITAIAAGYFHTVALASDGTVHTWGDNECGQLGNGTTNYSLVSIQVVTAETPMADKTITAVAAGLRYTVALASDGTVHTWGSNEFGQLGDGTTDDSPVPVQVTTTGSSMAGKTITAVAAGYFHTVALASGGTVHTWGENEYGQLGNGTTTSSPVTVPVEVDTTGTPMAGKTITAVTAGSYQTYALSSDQLGFSWGSGSGGELGNGTTSSSSVPTQIAAVPAGQAARVARRTVPKTARPPRS